MEGSIDVFDTTNEKASHGSFVRRAVRSLVKAFESNETAPANSNQRGKLCTWPGSRLLASSHRSQCWIQQGRDPAPQYEREWPPDHVWLISGVLHNNQSTRVKDYSKASPPARQRITSEETSASHAAR
jgi:hypothetical protein